MDRMNPLDASFLYMEDGITHMHIASCAIFEGPAPAYEDVVALFAAKIPLVPRYRQRVRFVPFDLGRPVWVDDPHFKLEYHIRHTALPPPGSEDDLRRLMGRLMSQELDRHRPLWEAWMVEGLEGGRWALISKVHHCMVDGIAGVDLISIVLDHQREPSPASPDHWSPDPEPTTLRLVTDAVWELATKPTEQLRAVAAAAQTPQRAIRHARDVLTGLRAYGAALRPTPPTSLDGPIGPHRRWAVARTTLDEIRTVKKHLGGTVNDVVLTAIAGGFRDLILARGEAPEHVVLRSLVPVSVRTESARGVFDNRVSAIFFDLPVGIEDPVQRLHAVRQRMDELKQSHEADAGEALVSLLGVVPATLTASGTRLAVRLFERVPQRSMNTVTTNVPGPMEPLYAVGREMLEYLPYVPLGAGVRLGVAILSYNGQIAIGVTGDYDSAPDIEVLAAGIERAIAALLGARPTVESGVPANAS